VQAQHLKLTAALLVVFEWQDRYNNYFKITTMKQILFFVSFFIITSFHSAAQNKQDEHLLDSTSMDIYYETGYSAHAEFNDGQIIFKKIGNLTDITGQESYRSKKIADKIYVVSCLDISRHAFVTYIFNFNQNILIASAIRTKDEANFLDRATIEHLHLKEN
jgi:hypothetical protein